MGGYLICRPDQGCRPLPGRLITCPELQPLLSRGWGFWCPGRLPGRASGGRRGGAPTPPVALSQAGCPLHPVSGAHHQGDLGRESWGGGAWTGHLPTPWGPARRPEEGGPRVGTVPPGETSGAGPSAAGRPGGGCLHPQEGLGVPPGLSWDEPGLWAVSPGLTPSPGPRSPLPTPALLGQPCRAPRGERPQESLHQNPLVVWPEE